MALVEEGKKLQAGGEEFTVAEYLGEGVTAEVYLGTNQNGDEVALKILRPGLPNEIAQNFRDEAAILRDFRMYETARGDGIQSVPRLHFSAIGADEHELEFLAMELITGRSLETVLEMDGALLETFGELAVLHIAQRVLRVLDILHTEMKRTYTDFQLKNIWIQDSSGLKVKVMDWNHVSKFNALDGVSDDLTRFGIYLYQLLTGKGASATGETAQSLSARTAAWSQISVGTQRLILKTLHPVPEQRWRSASQLLTALQTHIKLWEMPVDALSDEALPLLRKARRAEPQEAYDVLQEAQLYFDLYVKRGEDPALVQRFQDQLNELLGDVSPGWVSGQQYYKAETYSRTKSLWQDEATILGRLDLWRWVWLSHLADGLSRDEFHPIQTELEDLVKTVNEEKWDSAARLVSQLENIAAVAKMAAFRLFKYEVEAELAEQEGARLASIQQWESAADAYRQVQEKYEEIKNLPIKVLKEQYLPLLNQTFNWHNADQNRRDSMERAIDSQESIALEKKLTDAFSKSYDDGWDVFWPALIQRPQNKMLIQFGKTKIKEETDPQRSLHFIRALRGRAYTTTEDEEWLRTLFIQKQKEVVQLEEKAKETIIADARKVHKVAFEEQFARAMAARDWGEVAEVMAVYGGALSTTQMEQLQTEFNNAIADKRAWVAQRLDELMSQASNLSQDGQGKIKQAQRQKDIDRLIAEETQNHTEYFDSLEAGLYGFLAKGELDKAREIRERLVGMEGNERARKIVQAHSPSSIHSNDKKIETLIKEGHESIVRGDLPGAYQQYIQAYEVYDSMTSQWLAEPLQKKLEALDNRIRDEVKKKLRGLDIERILPYLRDITQEEFEMKLKDLENLPQQIAEQQQRGQRPVLLMGIMATALAVIALVLALFAFTRKQEPISTEELMANMVATVSVMIPPPAATVDEQQLRTDIIQAVSQMVPEPVMNNDAELVAEIMATVTHMISESVATTPIPTMMPTPLPQPTDTVTPTSTVTSTNAMTSTNMVTFTQTTTSTETSAPSNSPLPLTVIIEAGNSIPYDWPNLRIALDVGWSAIVATAETDPLIIESGSGDGTHALFLEITPIGDGRELVPTLVPILNSQVIVRETNATVELVVSWHGVQDTPPAPGNYTLAIAGDGESKVLLGSEVTIAEPILNEHTGDIAAYRPEPIWNIIFNIFGAENTAIVSGTVSSNIEIIGYVRVEPYSERKTEFPDSWVAKNSYFFLVRLPGTRTFYWLGDQYVQEYDRTNPTPMTTLLNNFDAQVDTRYWNPLITTTP